MPIRTGLSHAMLAVVLAILWVFFKRSLSVAVRDEHVLTFIGFVARQVHTYTGLSVEYGTVVTLTAITVITVVGFAWGYTFHTKRFGDEFE